MNKLYGYDIDGVCTKNIIKKTPFVIISGRTFSEYNKDEWCLKLSNEAPLYIRGIGEFGDRIAAGNFKSMMINYLRVNVFYEDDEIQAEIIRKECKHCEIILIK